MIEDSEEYAFRVLYAGDDPDLFREVEDILGAIKGARIELTRCVSCRDALGACRNGAFDVCLAAESLWDGSGLEFIRATGADSGNMPVIFLNDADGRTSNAEAMEAGAVDYLARGELNLSLLERSLRYAMERRQLQEEMGMLLKAAGESANAKTKFMASITHEVKTPLNTIIGMIDLSLESDLNDKQRQNLMLARSSSESLLNLMNNIIDYTLMESGKFTLENRTFSLREILKKIIRRHHVPAERKHIILTNRIGKDVPDMLYGDPERLGQIVSHLLSNAVKFTGQGEITLSIAVQEFEGSDVMLHWVVSDTGVGIPRESIDLIFQMFTQIDGSSTRKHGGVGLGLSIVRKLVTMLGGKIWVESEPGKKTLFHFTSRFSLSEQPPRARQANGISDSREGHPAADSGEAVKILVAEDSIVNQLVLNDLLERIGYDVKIVDNGSKAVEAAERDRYSAILMDLHMPFMDGYDASRMIRCRETAGNHVPIIALTGSEYRQDVERCMRAGMDDYLTKPYKDEALLAVLAKYAPPVRKPKTGPVGDNEIPESLGEHLDVSAVLENLAGNKRLFFEIMNYFLEEGPAQLKKVLTGLEIGDEEMIEKSAHKLKGMASNIGATRMADEAFRIQLAVRKGNMELPKELVNNLEQMLEGLRRALEMKREPE